MGTHTRDDETRISAEYFDPGDRWVPADRRWLGMDKRTLLPALVVLALALLQGVLLPDLDGAISETDVTSAGEVIAVQGGIGFTAAEGWSLVSGERRDDEPTGKGYPPGAVLARGGIQFVVRTGEFSGDPAALLDRIERTDAALRAPFTATGDPAPITARTGEPGLLTKYGATGADGVLAAYVIDGTGVEIVAVGPPEPAQDLLTEVGRMIASVGELPQEAG
ncbi:hypothetical protein ACTD5D_23970 [Nocardia takedensis]|uniref:hypothetical protein n=1 Tax=Nocardia takedensis TaxID=259390 RepID=UPI0002E3BF65|nr:hypothetical protein [Nocardia takedensis]